MAATDNSIEGCRVSRAAPPKNARIHNCHANFLPRFKGESKPHKTPRFFPSCRAKRLQQNKPTLISLDRRRNFNYDTPSVIFIKSTFVIEAYDLFISYQFLNDNNLFD